MITTPTIGEGENVDSYVEYEGLLILVDLTSKLGSSALN